MLSSWFVPPGPVSMRSLTPTASNAQVYWLALEKYQRKCRHCPCLSTCLKMFIYVFHFVSFISFTLWLQTRPHWELRTAVFSMVSDKHDAWTGLKRQGHHPVYIASPASLGVGCCEYIQRVGIAILFFKTEARKTSEFLPQNE